MSAPALKAPKARAAQRVCCRSCSGLRLGGDGALFCSKEYAVRDLRAHQSTDPCAGFVRLHIEADQAVQIAARNAFLARVDAAYLEAQRAAPAPEKPKRISGPPSGGLARMPRVKWPPAGAPRADVLAALCPGRADIVARLERGETIKFISGQTGSDPSTIKRLVESLRGRGIAIEVAAPEPYKRGPVSMASQIRAGLAGGEDVGALARRLGISTKQIHSTIGNDRRRQRRKQESRPMIVHLDPTDVAGLIEVGLPDDAAPGDLAGFGALMDAVDRFNARQSETRSSGQAVEDAILLRLDSLDWPRPKSMTVKAFKEGRVRLRDGLRYLDADQLFLLADWAEDHARTFRTWPQPSLILKEAERLFPDPEVARRAEAGIIRFMRSRAGQDALNDPEGGYHVELLAALRQFGPGNVTCSAHQIHRMREAAVARRTRRSRAMRNGDQSTVAEIDRRDAVARAMVLGTGEST